MGLVTKTWSSLTKRIRISNAQVLTMVTVDVPILPAPRAGHMWIPIYISIWLFPKVANYTNLDAGIAFGLIPLAPFNLNLAAANILGAALKAEGNSVFWEQTAGAGSAYSIFIANGALGNLTGGNPANVLNVQLDFAQALTA